MFAVYILKIIFFLLRTTHALLEKAGRGKAGLQNLHLRVIKKKA